MSKNDIALPNHIAKFINGLELTPVDQLKTMKPAQRVDAAAFGLKLELAGKLYAGFALLGLKEEMGHGKYLAALAEKGVAPRSANYCTNLVKLANRIPASNWQTFANLEPSKLDLMTSWTDDELKAFGKGEEVRGITFDDAQELSVRDIKSQLKVAQASNSELEQQLEKERAAKEKAEDKIRLMQRKQLEPEGFIYPASVEKVRIESSLLANQASACIDDLEQHMLALTQASDLSRDKEKQLAEFGAGATALYLNIKAVQSKATYLLGWFIESIGEDYVTDDIENIPSMTQEEALRIHSMWEVMLGQHDAEKLAREATRNIKRRGGKKGRK